jgi:HPt (histidine-containing phosphotransfer) domain-containing protein
VVERPRTGPTDPARAERAVGAMKPLRSRARATNLARAAQLAQALDAAAEGRLDEAGCSTAVDVAHQLVGSAGTFGYTGASTEAARLKDFFAARSFEPERVDTAREWLSALRVDLEQDAGHDRGGDS